MTQAIAIHRTDHITDATAIGSTSAIQLTTVMRHESGTSAASALQLT